MHYQESEQAKQFVVLLWGLPTIDSPRSCGNLIEGDLESISIDNNIKITSITFRAGAIVPNLACLQQ
jgi:hypothetical protein